MTSVSRRRVHTAVNLSIGILLGAAAGVGTLLAGAAPSGASTPGLESPASSMHTAAANAARVNATQGEGANDTGAASHLDRSGRQRIGKASFYAERYSGRTMADGTPMRPTSNNAASLTLPLGTTARVTNLETGKSAIITIRDRGPYVKGRIVDLSPATATLIGIPKRQGLANVAVTPITLPPLQTRGKSRLSARFAS